MPHSPRSAGLFRAITVLLGGMLCQLAPHVNANPICAEVIGSFAKEVASADFNGDGFADFAVTVEPNAVAIVLGQTGPPPTHLLGSIPTGAAVEGIAAGDLNGDGFADIVAAQPTANNVRVLLGHGDGTFSYGEPVDAGSNPYRPVLGDLDGDGDLDVALISGLGQAAPDEISILLNLGGGILGPRTAIDLTPYPSSQNDIACGDVDGDGDADVAVLRRDIVSGVIVKSIVLARSNGDGTFTASAAVTDDVSSSAIAVGDIDRDGRADLVARDGDLGVGGVPPPRRLSTYFGRADGSFDVPVRAPMANSLAGRLRLADMNGDGTLDAVMNAGPLFAPTAACGVSSAGVALGDGTGGFVEMPSVPAGGARSMAMAIGDADGDGNLDVAMTGENCGTLVLSPGSGDGTLGVLSYTSRLGRAFTLRNKEVIRLNTNKSNWCLGFESLDGSFNVATDVTSVTLLSLGTGSVSEVTSNPSKPIVLGDADNNGFADITVCFVKDQLRQLFSNLSGRQSVVLTVLGNLAGLDCPAEATLTVDVVPGGNNAAAFFRRDASRDAWTIAYRAERDGPARLRIFDVHGRLLRSLGSRAASAGWNDLRFDGLDRVGRRLPSGVFYYRLEQGTESVAGKFVIAR